MMKPLLLLACCFPILAAKNITQLFEDVSKTVTQEIADAKHPVEQIITTIGSSQCQNVKKIVGVAYKEIDGGKEPDLNQLNLKFINKDYTVTFNINHAAKSIPDSKDFNPHQKLFIYVHGFTDDPSKAGFSNISDALFRQGECNVLALDGSSLIHWLYLRASTYVQFMGRRLGEVLAAMVNRGGDPREIHIIGHSLGAHISGFTGKTFTALTGKKVGRISGLDPAGPCFSHLDENLRLHKTDADYVDVVHSDAGVFGLWDPVGHADYFPNEGTQQPNCFFQTCSHSRAWLYYTESVINPKAFPAVKCRDWSAFKKGKCERRYSYMGHQSVPGTHGQFFLQTGGETPFGLGEQGTVFNNTEGVIKTITGLVG